ncbi:MAG: S1 RNA-binding domain-containing protein [Candidatus Aenigmatarchaeota archaeon]
MVKKRGLPSVGDFVICKISRINPNSAFAILEEYEGLEGMIHISEISSGWVKDIRKFVKLGDNVVAKVLGIDEKGHISLSIKRVNNKQKNDKIREYKLNQRAEKMLEIVAQKFKKNLDQAYEEIGYELQEKFGSLHIAFKKSLENPKLLIDRGFPEKWVKYMVEIAKKNMEQKEFEFKAMLMLKTYKPDGIKIIKEILNQLREMNLTIKYIAAPNYLIKYKTMQAKKGEKEFKEILNKIISLNKDVESKFEILGE